MPGFFKAEEHVWGTRVCCVVVMYRGYSSSVGCCAFGTKVETVLFILI